MICLMLSSVVASRCVALSILNRLTYSPGESPVCVLNRWERCERDRLATPAISLSEIFRSRLASINSITVVTRGLLLVLFGATESLRRSLSLEALFALLLPFFGILIPVL